MKFGQVIEYNKSNTFFKNHAQSRRLVPDLFLFLKKRYIRCKQLAFRSAALLKRDSDTDAFL